LILEVIDASDPEHEEHLETTSEVLADLELAARPRLAVFNKIDRLPPEERANFQLPAGAVAVSANDASTLGPLLDAISFLYPTLRPQRIELSPPSSSP
jgi:GTP-binding protein HflX